MRGWISDALNKQKAFTLSHWFHHPFLTKDVSEASAHRKYERIDRETLIAAVETELPNVEHFLDLRSGEILIIVGGIRGADADTGDLDEIARDNRENEQHGSRRPRGRRFILFTTGRGLLPLLTFNALRFSALLPNYDQ